MSFHDRNIEERRVHVYVEFLNFRISRPQLVSVQTTLNVLRQGGLATKGKQQKILPIIGPSGSGKSTIVKDWCERIERAHPLPEGSHPILHVTLTANATVTSLGTDIIYETEGDMLPPEVIADAARRGARTRVRKSDIGTGTRPQMTHLAKRMLRNAKTELLVLDEMHHLIQSDGANEKKWSVTETVKWLSIKAECPIVLIGIPRLMQVLSGVLNKQLAGRTQIPIVLLPLNWAVLEEREDFIGYVGAVDNKLVEHDIFPKKSNLHQGNWIHCFYDFSRGIVGRVSNLVEHAANLAIARGVDRIHIDDLVDATNIWGIRMGMTDHNPWVNKPRETAMINELGMLER
jgi:type II secretory pathway predicted ATPase ExeA